MTLTPENALASFHPVLQRWFTETLGTPTTAQRLGWAAIREKRHTLIAAPTGSGKTLAAFLNALDELFVEAQAVPLQDEVRVVYVSPLKALSADIHKNLAEPRRGIQRIAGELGLDAPRITAAVRTGDTSSSERASMLKTPPHILVTTPESLYLLLTAERSREMLRSVRTVIVDEIHAVIGTRRGAHLAVSLERLAEVADQPLQRIGLSATQKPIEDVAKWLEGCDPESRDAGVSFGERLTASGEREKLTAAARQASPLVFPLAARRLPLAIVDEGHKRAMDLTLEMPRSPLDAVMSHEVWEEYYDRLTQLITEHRTTLVFVNTRRMAERVARHLSDRLGDDAVTAHHGSLSKDNRLDAETRLKSGRLKALVATASLELGIDIGYVDLVCQIGSPHRIATLLQRVGRSGHTVSGLPKGRLFPVSRDDLVECAALLRAVKHGELDRILEQDAPLDVLAQQIVAETSCRDYSEDELYALVRRAWPYRALSRHHFDAVVVMVAEGFATKRGRRSALVHRDEVNGHVRGRRGARMLAITSGGAIPEVADYRVILEGEETFIGTLNEDFAIESNAGDIFQLGNASWLITQVGAGVVRVADAKGAPPTIPFWLGEAPARSDELSLALSDLRKDFAELAPHPPFGHLLPAAAGRRGSALDEGVLAFEPPSTTGCDDDAAKRRGSALDWLIAETNVPREAAEEIVNYLMESQQALGVLPTQETLVVERFFDESGGMQLVIHTPFGSRINKAWGLALRKRFCRQFNFELQAAATEDALLLSLGPQHSFPLADVFHYLHPATARDILVQAFLDAPVFQTRWRWNTTISLAVPRNRNGKKVPPQLQRMIADDLMAAAFPDAAACFENIPGDRQIPDHPLVNQVVRDCLEEAMDFDGLSRLLTRIHAGELQLVARDTTEPSPLCHEILNAKPYSFLDDAPLEERRTQAVYTRRSGSNDTTGAMGALDAAAIDRVREEERPDPRDADELHDALLTAGFLTEEEAVEIDRGLFEKLVAQRRAGLLHAALTNSPSPRRSGEKVPEGRMRGVWVAAERLPEWLAIHPETVAGFAAPPSRAARAWTAEEALVELVRGRMSIVGPTTAAELATTMSVAEGDVDMALLKLETEGVVLRGNFDRAERPATHASSLMPHSPYEQLEEWQLTGVPRFDSSLPPPATHAQSKRQQRQQRQQWCDRRLLARIHRYTLNRLRAEIEPVGAADFMRFLFVWQHVAPQAKLTGIDGLQQILAQLDGFELAAAAWEKSILPLRVERYEPSLLDTLSLAGEVGWARLSAPTGATPVGATPIALFLRDHAAAWQTLRDSPPIVLGEDAQRVLELLRARGASFARDLGAEEALAELVAAGLVTSDGFAGLRSLIGTAASARLAGRWSLLSPIDAEGGDAPSRDDVIELQARALLRRYGVVCRRLLTRDSNAAPWRDLARVYRRLEARGEIRGGRFVHGLSGEQFALPEAIERLRELRRTPPDGKVVVLSAADPLNLTGILTTGERVRAIASNRIAFRDGIAVSVMEGDMLRPLVDDADQNAALDIAAALAGRRVAVAEGWVGRV